MECCKCGDRGYITGYCPRCNGSGKGKHEGSKCSYCRGTGQVFLECWCDADEK